MNSLRDLMARLARGVRRLPLAANIISPVVLAYATIVAFSIIPDVRTWRNLSSQVESAQKAVVVSQNVQADSPETLGQRIAAAEARVDEAASVFLTESQAAEVATRLYECANESDVEIIGLQSQPGKRGGNKELYNVRSFNVQAAGALPKLICFLARSSLAASKGFAISSLTVTEGEGLYDLTMDIGLYLSTYAPEEPLLPVAYANLAAPLMSLKPLEDSLASAWAAGQWPQAIALIEHILAVDPARDDMSEKLYAAHVNYGYWLLKEGDTAGAAAQFNLALKTKPRGAEAMAGLREATTAPEPTPTAGTAPLPTPTPPTQPIVHTVRAGDTLYSIARHYGTTVEAIMIANELDSPIIRVGQQLHIPGD